MNRPTFEDFKKEALEDPEIRKEYERLAPIWNLKRKKIKLRLEKQKQKAQTQIVIKKL